VLAFWATWCAPCREELPRINALYARYRKTPGVAFLAVDTEREADFDPSATKVSLPLAAGESDSRKNLGVYSLPTLIIIDQAGNIRLVHTGYDGAENLERMVDEQITTLLRSEG
jgi:thiol-disulfide isomerase/thioredoxin